MVHCYVKFEVANIDRYEALCRLLDALRITMSENEERSDEEWKVFFDQAALDTFWWPSEEEVLEHSQEWLSKPIEERFMMPPTPWDFGSMIDTLLSNEWIIVGARLLQGGEAVLEFDPLAYPYGGVGCLFAVVEAFGHRVTEYEDGIGVKPYKPVKEYWKPLKLRNA